MKLVPAKTTPVPAPLMPRSWYDDVPRATKTHKVLGYTAVAITVLGFGLLATLPLVFVIPDTARERVLAARRGAAATARV